VQEPRGDDAAGALVPVDAAEDKDPRRPGAEREEADGLPARALADRLRADPVPGDADVHVVVVVRGEWLDDGRRAPQAQPRPDEDLDGAGRDEPLEQVLGQVVVDLPAGGWGALAPVAARVIDVGIEAVLVRRVAGRAEAPAELAAVLSGEIADHDACGAGVRLRVLVQHAGQHPDEAGIPIPPPAGIRRALAHVVPGGEIGALRRQPDAADKPPIPRHAERPRARRGARD
jgi:hypothetical protein